MDEFKRRINAFDQFRKTKRQDNEFSNKIQKTEIKVCGVQQERTRTRTHMRDEIYEEQSPQRSSE